MNRLGGTAPPRSFLSDLAAGWRPWALLAALCVALFLPGLSAMPPLDRDEARFMQATRQMLESGDFVDIRFQDEARNKKPAGIYWLQAAAVAAFSAPASNAAWPYRLPSVLGATLAVLLTFAGGAPLVGRPGALLAAALLASSLLLIAEAHLAKTDAVLLATIVAAQLALGRVYGDARRAVPSRRRHAAAFWAAQGLGILIKGPVAPLISLATILALGIADRRWSWLARLRPAWGVPLLLAIAGPWLVAIEWKTGGAFGGEAVGHDLLGKLLGAQESHGAPPGAYLLLAPATMWPASAFLGLAWISGWRARTDVAARFLLAWLVPAWLIFELIPTKLPHYVLPLYPALALLAGRALAGRTLAGTVERRLWLDGIVFALWILVGAVLATGLIALPIRLGHGFAVLSLVPALAAAAIAVGLAVRLRRGFTAGAVPLVAILAVLVAVPSFAALLPGLDTLWLSRSAAALVAAHPAAAPRPVDAVGYDEPSLVFLLHGALRATTPGRAAADLASGAATRALVSDREEAAFRAALAARGLAPAPLGTASGIDYSRGGALRRLTLYAGPAG